MFGQVLTYLKAAGSQMSTQWNGVVKAIRFRFEDIEQVTLLLFSKQL